MGLSIPGCIANYYWTQIPDQFQDVILDEYVVMPNHMHGTIAIRTGREVIYGIRNQNLDAINRVTTDQIGSPIHGDPNYQKQNNIDGATGKNNPMLYKTHLGKIIRWYKGWCTFEIRKREYYDFA